MGSDVSGLSILRSLQHSEHIGSKRPDIAKPEPASEGFDSTLQGALREPTELRFSAHATRRLEARGIELSGKDLNRLSQAVGQAEAKGSRESLVVMGDLAAIVSIKNKTVVTVLEANNTEQVFTNIDSTVIVKK
ncbi:flagellar protein [bacterium]|nr:flagellar protein [bacterium]